MNRLSIIFLVFGLLTVKIFAQTTNVQKIVDQVSAKVKSAKTITANFTIAVFDKYNHPGGGATGIVKLKGDKYYVKEAATEIFCNGEQVWNYDGNDEATLSKVDKDDEDKFSPQQILSGFNKTDYNYKLVSSTSTLYNIAVTPVDKRKNFKEIILSINKKTNLVSKAKVTDKINNVTQLTFTAIVFNTKIDDTQFVFNAAKHTNVKVVNQ